MRRIGLVAICVGLVLGGCVAAAPVPAPTPLPTEAQAAPAAASATPAITATPTPAATPSAGTAAASPAAGKAAPSPTAGQAAAPKPAAIAPALGPLTLLVSEPPEDTVEVAAGARGITVAGRTRPDAVVSVNGKLVPTDAAGAFRVEVPLDDELSLVEVIASDAAGQQLREQFVIVRAD